MPLKSMGSACTGVWLHRIFSEPPTRFIVPLFTMVVCFRCRSAHSLVHRMSPSFYLPPAAVGLHSTGSARFRFYPPPGMDGAPPRTPQGAAAPLNPEDRKARYRRKDCAYRSTGRNGWPFLQTTAPRSGRFKGVWGLLRGLGGKSEAHPGPLAKEIANSDVNKRFLYRCDGIDLNPPTTQFLRNCFNGCL